MTPPENDNQLHIVFVCTGNICRSPMAEIITHDAMETDMLDLLARVSSCGLGGWHVGQGADERAIAELRRAGHDGAAHRAAQLGEEHMDADLFIAMDSGHRDELIRKVLTGRGKIEVGRFKGLGEMNAGQLKETTMDKKKRTMLRVDIEDAAEATKTAVDALMGTKPELRFRFIQERAEFATEEALDI